MKIQMKLIIMLNTKDKQSYELEYVHSENYNFLLQESCFNFIESKLYISDEDDDSSLVFGPFDNNSHGHQTQNK